MYYTETGASTQDDDWGADANARTLGPRKVAKSPLQHVISAPVACLAASASVLQCQVLSAKLRAALRCATAALADSSYI